MREFRIEDISWRLLARTASTVSIGLDASFRPFWHEHAWFRPYIAEHAGLPVPLAVRQAVDSLEGNPGRSLDRTCDVCD